MKRKAKVEEFIHLRQKRSRVQEYSLKFIQFYKYALYLVSNTRDNISHFVTGVSNDLVEACREALLHDNIGIYL